MSRDTTAERDGAWDILKMGGGIPGTYDYMAERDAMAKNFHDVFNTPQGKEVLKHIEAFVYRNAIVQQGPNMAEIALVEGAKREIVEFIQYQMLIAEGEK